MKVKIIACLILIGLLLACHKKVELTQEERNRAVQDWAARIMELTEGMECNDPSGWAYIGFGNKPCGGPSEYIAYPTSINMNYLLYLLEQHKLATMNYNQNGGWVGDCGLTPVPKDVICDNGKPVLVY